MKQIQFNPALIGQKGVTVKYRNGEIPYALHWKDGWTPKKTAEDIIETAAIKCAIRQVKAQIDLTEPGDSNDIGLKKTLTHLESML